MSASQFCARWGCTNTASYEKPLCYSHWLEWEEGELEECNRCRQFYDAAAMVVFWEGGWDEEFPPYCNDCLWVICQQQGREPPWFLGPKGVDKPVLAHGAIPRTARYIYVLKLSDNTYYVGQTTDLAVRLLEHKDGLQRQTAKKNPKLVYFEEAPPGKRSAEQRENKLIELNKTGSGRRALRRMIEDFRGPLRLLDLEA